jgi:predicted RNase H-like HicB family nuclease
MKSAKVQYENNIYTGVFVDSPEGGFSAYIKEVSGVNTQGETIAEAKENLMDALRFVLEVNQSLKAY